MGNGTEGELYSTTLVGSGGQAPYDWFATGLPPGLSIVDGTISGTPEAGTAGNYEVIVTALDATFAVGSRVYSLTIDPPPCASGSGPERMPSLSTVTLSPNPPPPGTWGPDRAAPESFAAYIGTFQGRTNVLQVGLDGTGPSGVAGAGSGEPGDPTQMANPAFAALRGRTNYAPAPIPGAWTLSADLWIESSWSTSANGLRRAEVWPQSSNARGFVAGLPALGFTNEGSSGTGRFRWATGNWNETWFNVPAATAPVNYDAWNSFQIEFVPANDLFKYYINCVEVAEFTSIVPDPDWSPILDGTPTLGGTSIGYHSVILQTYNYSANPPGGYVVHWANRN